MRDINIELEHKRNRLRIVCSSCIEMMIAIILVGIVALVLILDAAT
jgi:hypothetical protein